MQLARTHRDDVPTIVHDAVGNAVVVIRKHVVGVERHWPRNVVPQQAWVVALDELVHMRRGVIAVLRSDRNVLDHAHHAVEAWLAEGPVEPARVVHTKAHAALAHGFS